VDVVRFHAVVLSFCVPRCSGEGDFRRNPIRSPGSHFHQIIVEPGQNFLFQVETTIQYTFRDGTTEALGFVVNPLVFTYGLPLLFGLVMGSDASWLRKAAVLAVGYITITFVQVWGVVFNSLKMLAFNFGAQTHELVREAGVSDSVIALGYQLGTLILPALAPILSGCS
jgi:hypothetical protein